MYRIHYTPSDLDREIERFEFPDHFDMGCSTAGYQVEGGFNGPNDPKNNWYWAEERGEKARTGECVRFLDLWEEDLDRAKAIGLNAFRMGIEWARLQPGVDPAMTAPPPFSTDAARLYARIMAGCMERGMFPAVTLHHYVNPLWAGLDFWLDRGRVTELFGAYVDFAVREINRLLIEEFGQKPIPYYITINEPVGVPMATYYVRQFPRGGAPAGMRTTVVAYENQLIGHVIAYRRVHAIYKEMGWPAPTVTTNSINSAVYGMDKMAQDLFTARVNGVSRTGLTRYITEQKTRFDAHVARVPYLRGPQFVKRFIDRLVDRQMWALLKDDVMPHLADLLFEGDDARILDAMGFDFYDPFLGNNLDIEFPRLVRARVKPWDWNVNPTVIGAFLSSYAWNAKGLEIHLLENGMSYRGVGAVGYPRLDRAKRIDVLKATFFECLRSMNQGIPLRTYFYWSLIDNYEWGSFEPRFGLFGVDLTNRARRLNTDIMGDNAAGAYSLFVRAMRGRDKTALREAFMATKWPEIKGSGQ